MPSSRRFQVGIFFGFSIAVAIYLLRLDAVAGNWRDDGWYIILAKGLASGHGFELICSPRPTIYFYPPVFPVLLAAVFRVFPEFPANLWLLKAVSIVAAFACAPLVYLYCRQRDNPKSVSFMIAAFTLLSPVMVFIATSSVLSEPVFCVFVFGALLTIERWTKTQRGSWLYVAALLSALAFLTRVQGITLVLSVVLWFLCRRQRKQALAYGTIVLAVVMPWLVYRQTVRGIPSVIPGYRTQFWDRLASSDQKVTWRALPARAYQNTSAIGAASMGALFAPSVYRAPIESGSEVLNLTAAPLSRDFIGAGVGSMGGAWQTKLISLVFSLFVLTGFIQTVRLRPSVAEPFFLAFCGSAIIWPWPAFRLIFPMYPLLCLYLVTGISFATSRLSQLRRKLSETESVARIVLAAIVGLFLMDHAVFIMQSRGLVGVRVVPEFTRHFEQVRSASEWVRDHTQTTALVTGSNLPQVHLYSGRQVDYCRGESCEKAGIHFWVYEQVDRDLPASAVVYDSGGGVVVLNGDPSLVR